MMDARLKDKVVVITGASGGIGEACARAFADEGAKLVLHGYRHVKRLHKLQHSLGVENQVLQADLTQEAEVETMFKKAIERFSKLHVLIANAGIWDVEDVPIQCMSLDNWEKMMKINQTSIFLCARAFFQCLVQNPPKSAALVIIGSASALFGEEGHAHYSAAKAAITYGLTHTLKNEIIRIIPRGRVNAVCPSWTKTPMVEVSLRDKSTITRSLQTHAIARIAEPEDVAHAVVFLSSDKLAGQISGEILAITGGMEGRVLHQPKELEKKLG